MTTQRKTNLKKEKIYKFEWNDTYTNEGWFDDAGIDNNTIKKALQVSVGFFIKEKDNWYVIAKHKNEHQTFAPWGDLSWIPKGVVVKITQL